MEPLLNAAFLLPAMAGVIFIIAGLVLLRRPPKSINKIYGYRTRSSMKSQERWDFAQNYSSKKMIFWGIVLVCISPLGLYFGTTETLSLIIGLGATLIVIAPMVIQTETAIKREFPDEP